MGLPALSDKSLASGNRDKGQAQNNAAYQQTITHRKRERARATIATRLAPIITNLCNCAEGLTDMTPSQLRAALGLLNKVLPDAVADPANATGQTLAQILAEIAMALPSGTQVGIAVSSAQDGPLVTPADSNIYVADDVTKDSGLASE